jgi:hypothetical protein
MEVGPRAPANSKRQDKVWSWDIDRVSPRPYAATARGGKLALTVGLFILMVVKGDGQGWRWRSGGR